MVKKFLLMFAACAMFVACGGDEKKSEQTVEQKATIYAQQFFDAADAEFKAYLGEEVEIPVSSKDVLNEFATWLKTLDDDGKVKAYEAIDAAEKDYGAKHDVSFSFPDYSDLQYYLY